MFDETGIVGWGLVRSEVHYDTHTSIAFHLIFETGSLSKVTGRKSQGSVRGETPRGKILTSESRHSTKGADLGLMDAETLKELLRP